MKISRSLIEQIRRLNGSESDEQIMMILNGLIRHYDEDGLVVVTVHSNLSQIENIGQILDIECGSIESIGDMCLQSDYLYHRIQQCSSSSSSDDDNEYISGIEVKWEGEQQMQTDTDLVLSRQLIERQNMSYGKLDVYFISDLCVRLERVNGSQIGYHYLLGNGEINREYQRVLIDMMSQERKVLTETKKYDYIHRLIDVNGLEIDQILMEIENELLDQMVRYDREQQDRLEEVLIGMLGHEDQKVREKSVVYLNVLYDENDWQLNQHYNPKVKQVGDQMMVQYLIEEYQVNGDLMIMLTRDRGIDRRVCSWHRVNVKQYQDKYLVEINLGVFKQCGYYDWKLVQLDQKGLIKEVNKMYEYEDNVKQQKMENSQIRVLNKVQGRFIVQNQQTSQLMLHEVYLNHSNNFNLVKESVHKYKKEHINGLYLMGGLERDNQIQQNQMGLAVFGDKEAPALACVDRARVSSMLGGELSFRSLVRQCNQEGIKVIMDSFQRISSSRHHRKYNGQYVHYLDHKGHKQLCYGVDGRSNDCDDTVQLNYRKKQNWDLLIEEVIEFNHKYNVDGFQLDHGNSWPYIKQMDHTELYRKDVDGQNAYSDLEIFQGVVVQRDIESGYYSTTVSQDYPNPFIIKLCKELWKRFNHLIIIGEVWGQMEDNRQINMIKSGLIPREYQLPIMLASIFGQKLNRDGSIQQIDKKDVNIFKSFHKHMNNQYPKGSLVIQSSTSHCWPYPALLYKRGAWLSVDILFLLNHIPITFMGEIYGEAYRQKTTNVYTSNSQRMSKSTLTLNQLDQSSVSMSSSLMDSQSNLMKHSLYKVKRESMIDLQLKQYQTQIHQESQDVFIIHDQPKQSINKIASGISSSQLSKEQIPIYQNNLNKEVGPEYGFDLSKISEHYIHRRLLRKNKKVFTEGKFIELQAEHDNGWHTQVLVFGRYYKNELAVVAVNFNNGPAHCYLDLKNIRFLFDNYDNQNIILELQDWDSYTSESDKSIIKDYYFLSELIDEKQYIYLKPYTSQVWGINIIQDKEEYYELAVKRSVHRLKKKIDKGDIIQSNEIALKLVHLIKNTNDVQTFMNAFGWIYENYIKKYKIDISKMIVLIKSIKEDQNMGAKFYSFLKHMKQIEHETIPSQVIDQLLSINQMNYTLFACPELGRWSTVGGLGVMVNELSEGLATLGEQISVVSPYYHKNRKGEVGYLQNDPEGDFKHITTFTVWVGGDKYDIGLHRGMVKGVELLFLHNSTIFPHCYADGDTPFTLKQLSVFGKAVLEMTCQLRQIPSLIVTNDWFCGLVAAYAKNNNFGDVFNATKFFHIVHNLDALYEGRLYLSSNENNLNWIHELPNEWFIDPYWSQKVLNPSRCALMTTDNWGTVSNSYKQDLLQNSPLQNLLARFNKSFAFPNGINKKQREQRLKDACKGVDHLSAKKILQQKYFRFNDIDDSICLMAFVGRITKQKGIHLILESLDSLIQQYNGKVQILIGGMASPKEQYGNYCINLINQLKFKYPLLFWAQPDAFFVDGPLVNLGADFGLMPSLFEPCGIVQQEFFVAETPVIAFKTGGLKDTVNEYDPKTSKGNGIHFEQHNIHDLVMAIKRAVNIFSDKKHYRQMRSNAYQSVIDLQEVSRAWNTVFYQTCNKIFIGKSQIKHQLSQIDNNFNIHNYKPTNIYKPKPKGHLLDENQQQMDFFNQVVKMRNQKNYRKHLFEYVTKKAPRPRHVCIIGSWDDWQTKFTLNYDHYHSHYAVTLQLKPGEYLYKFVIDDEWICSNEHPKNNDIFGNINNYTIIN